MKHHGSGPDGRLGAESGSPGRDQSPGSRSRAAMTITWCVAAASERDAGRSGGRQLRCGGAGRGRQENMTLAPHVLPGSRDGFGWVTRSLIDSMIVDGLWGRHKPISHGIRPRTSRRSMGILARDAGRVRRRIQARRLRRAGRSLSRGNRGGSGAREKATRCHSWTMNSPRRSTVEGMAALETGLRKEGQRDGRQCLGDQ